MLYVRVLIAVVVSVDILSFMHHFAERLIANVGTFWCSRRSAS